jgi:hypothetical protein
MDVLSFMAGNMFFSFVLCFFGIVVVYYIFFYSAVMLRGWPPQHFCEENRGDEDADEDEDNK